MPKKLTFNEFINRSNKIHKNKYNYSKSKYFGNRIKTYIICPFHGKFKQFPYVHMIGGGCLKCRNKKFSIDKRKTKKKFVKDAIKIHKNIYKYTNVKYINSTTKIEITCKIHGEFKQLPYAHLNGQGCPNCYTKNKKSNIDIFIQKANEIHNKKYNYSNSIYILSNKKTKIECKSHGEFYQTPTDHLGGHGCPKCAIKISKPEINFLNYLNIKIRNKYIKPYRVDGINMKKNIIYEFLGDYYHGNPEVFDHSKYNKTCHETYKKLYEKTFKKFKTLKDLGYNVKYIWENDWNKFKKRIDKEPKIQSF